MRILLITPPMTQLNTPYPATAYLTGCLRAHAGDDVEVAQADFSLELFLRLFSRDGMLAVKQRLEQSGVGVAVRRPARRAKGTARLHATSTATPATAHFLAHADRYAALVEPVLRFLQGARSQPRAAHRRAGLPARGAALRRARPGRRRRRPARLGVRRARDDRPRAPPGQPLRRRSRRRRARGDRPALRAVPLRREAGRERRDVRRARGGARRRADAGRRDARRAGRRAGARARARRRRVDGAVPGQRLRRAAHRPRRQGRTAGDPDRAGRRLRQHRAAPADRSARVRRLRLHHARRRRAAAAGADRSPARRRAPAVSHLRARRRARRVQDHAGAVRSAPPRDRHADLRRAAARALRLAVRDAEPDAPPVGRRSLEQADRGARLLLEEVHLLRRHARLHRALRDGVGRGHRRSDRGAGARDRRRPASTSSTRRRRRRRCARWPNGSSSASWRSPGGATSASRRASRRRWSSCWRGRAASPSAAGWRSRRIAC